MQTAVNKLRKTSSQAECVYRAYKVLASKYHGNRIRTFLNFFEVFPRSMETAWDRGGFLHCTNVNWLLKTLLMHTGRFTGQDVRTC